MSPPVFAAAFNVVVELSLLGCSGTVVFFDFSAPVVIVFSSDLQLKTCYDIVSLPYLFIFAKLSIRQNGSFSCSYGALLKHNAMSKYAKNKNKK